MRRRLRRTYRLAKYVVYRQTLLEPEDHFWTFIGAFVGIALIGFMQKAHAAELDQVFLIGSFGASAVLVFGAANSPLAQPRNLILGHLLSALIGVTTFRLFPSELWLSSALAVSLSIVAMQITRSMHPPGGATALIASVGSDRIKSLGYGYVISPVMSGVVILLFVALVINNLPRHRRYPARRQPRATVRRRSFAARHDAVPHPVGSVEPTGSREAAPVAEPPVEKPPRTASPHPARHAPVHPHTHAHPHTHPPTHTHTHHIARPHDHGTDHRHHRHDHNSRTAPSAAAVDVTYVDAREAHGPRALTTRPSSRGTEARVPDRADDKAA